MMRHSAIKPVINNTESDSDFEAEIIRAQRLIEDAIIILSTMQDKQGLELATPPALADIIEAVSKSTAYLYAARTGVPYMSMLGGIRRYPAGDVK